MKQAALQTLTLKLGREQSHPNRPWIVTRTANSCAAAPEAAEEEEMVPGALLQQRLGPGYLPKGAQL